jgi:hemoglobin-like flavoprotein
MALDVSILRESFATVVERSPQVIARFYEIFFERYPEVRPMFGRAPAGIARQEKMLTDALVAVLDHLEDAPWLQETLFALGEKHVGYGVRDEMYGWVGQCLLAALAEAAGDAWTKEVEAQWGEAFGAIQSMMLAGAHATRANTAKTSEQVTVI